MITDAQLFAVTIARWCEERSKSWCDLEHY
jgi:hypothetical protein